MRLLGDLSNLSVDIAAVQETHFICEVDARVLEEDYVVLSAFNDRCSTGVSLLIGRSLNVDFNLVFTGDGGRLVDAVKSFAFRVVAVYVPNSAGERHSFFGGWSRFSAIRCSDANSR